jgi:hypothetical protein
MLKFLQQLGGGIGSDSMPLQIPIIGPDRKAQIDRESQGMGILRIAVRERPSCRIHLTFIEARGVKLQGQEPPLQLDQLSGETILLRHPRDVLLHLESIELGSVNWNLELEKDASRGFPDDSRQQHVGVSDDAV